MLYINIIKEKGLRTWGIHISSLRMCGIDGISSSYWKMSQGARLRAPSIGDLAASSKKSWSVLLSCYISYVLLARSIDLRWHDDLKRWTIGACEAATSDKVSVCLVDA